VSTQVITNRRVAVAPRFSCCYAFCDAVQEADSRLPPSSQLFLQVHT